MKALWRGMNYKLSANVGGRSLTDREPGQLSNLQGQKEVMDQNTLSQTLACAYASSCTHTPHTCERTHCIRVDTRYNQDALMP